MRRFSLPRMLAVFLAVAGATSAAAPPAAAQGNCVAAMVNDLPITAFELSQRVRFTLMVSRVADNADNRDKMGRQVLRQMIDERLQLDDAKRNGITVSQAEIDERIQRLEQDNNMPAGGVKASLSQAGIPLTVLTDTFRAQIAWSKVVLRKLRAGIVVSEAEVEEAMRQLRANVGKSESRVAEIFLPVDRADQSDEVLRTARRIVEQLRGGASFPGLVQQFSSGASAAAGGDLGWVLPGTLDPALDAAIARMSVNQVSEPVRTQAGWHVLKLLGQRGYGRPGNTNEARFNMIQLLLPLPPNSSPDEVERQKGIAQGIISQSKSCADLRRACARAKGCTTGDSDGVAASSLPPAIGEAARNAPIGQGLGPFYAGNVMQVVAVCSRDGDGSLPARESVERGLQMSKLEAASRRYMRDIRRTAIINIRSNCRI
ncbi:peptidylprolyl isomerase [Vineibacter terrae]|uniref:peptidylprolyl isomerase n=1 Tax=Vineibacter terrae TaxID=2586908 RepID=UPI002E2F2D24|nr:peptidylprolyl isomerase [Vineibacter terrae]HEX2886976.1 peptidylprolyl isomerase [Vineibacter terrae]